jgi:hypothetical protein
MPSLNSRQWFAVLRIISIALQVRLVRILVKKTSMHRYVFNLMNANPRVRRPALPLDELLQVTDEVGRVLPSYFSFLELALAANFVARHHGWAATVRLANTKEQAAMIEAWLEVDGRPIFGRDPSFQTLMTQEERCL